MAIDRLPLAALDSAAIDHESVSSVCTEIAEFLGEPISEKKLFSVFRALEAQGLLVAYRAGSAGLALVPTQSRESDVPSEVWFRVSAEGREVLNREWERVFGPRGNERRRATL